MTSIIGTDSDFGAQSEDMEAINTYMRTTPIVNNAAFPIKDDFIRWWDGLGLWSKSIDSDAYDEARTRRNKFNLANVKTEEQRANVVRVITTGVTTEEMQNKPRPTTLSTGEVGKQAKKKGTSTMTPSASVQPDLTIGSRGAAVSQWQTIVKILPPTGYFGTVTQGKTKQWQQDHGLPVTGIVDSATWASALGAPTPSAPTPFAPPPVPPAPGPSPFKPTPTPKQPKQPTPPKPGIAHHVEKAKVVAASMFDVSSWSMATKVAAGLTLLSGVAYAFFGHKKV